jgi:two-component sensor histidine kinase
MDHFEVEQDFPTIGPRTMLLNARKVFYQGDLNTTLLLAIEDITDRRIAERLLHSLSEQKDMLLSEMSHRVANSLQIIASILLLKARSVQSEETREHLEDAHRRVMSVASLQQHLKATGMGEEIEVGAYLSTLCEALSGSVVRERRPITLSVAAGQAAVRSEQAVSIGLIVTELVINALKYAFSVDIAAGEIVVGYKVNGAEWALSVSDNGGGMLEKPDKKSTGLGTTLVKALAQQLGAQVEIKTGKNGTVVSIASSKI